MEYEPWRDALCAAIIAGDKAAIRALVARHPRPVEGERLYAVLLQNDDGELQTLCVRSDGEPVKPDEIIEPDQKIDFLNIHAPLAPDS